MIANILQYLGTLAIFIALAAELTFGIGNVLLLLVIADDIKNDLNSIDRIHQTKSNQSIMFEQLWKFIKFHSDVKELNE